MFTYCQILFSKKWVFPFTFWALKLVQKAFYIKLSFSQCLKIVKKVAFNIASEASYVYIFGGQKFIKIAKNGQFFVDFLKTWILRWNSVTRHVRNCWKMPKFKNLNATFFVIFNHCAFFASDMKHSCNVKYVQNRLVWCYECFLISSYV